MSEIDWDKAPEGATHYSILSGMFYKFSGDSAGKFWSYDLREWLQSGAIKDYEPMIKRPSKAWSGDGLPPVGVVCEANFAGEWRRFELRYYGEAYVVFKTAFEVQRTRHDFDTCGVKFRPIRTPEQIAADEREAAIEQMINDATNPMDDRMIFEKYPGDAFIHQLIGCLYNAGYRKP